MALVSSSARVWNDQWLTANKHVTNLLPEQKVLILVGGIVVQVLYAFLLAFLFFVVAGFFFDKTEQGGRLDRELGRRRHDVRVTEKKSKSSCCFDISGVKIGLPCSLFVFGKCCLLFQWRHRPATNSLDLSPPSSNLPFIIHLGNVPENHLQLSSRAS
jgi:hypothetical protein